MSGKQVIFDRGDGNRFRIDVNRINWNKAKFPRGYVVTKGPAPVVEPEPEDDDGAIDDSANTTAPVAHDLTIRELRELAKERGVSLPAGGTRNSIITALRDAGVEVAEAEDVGAV